MYICKYYYYYYYYYYFEKNEMGGAHGAYEGGERCAQGVGGKPE
jgi:hypothetical protein